MVIFDRRCRNSDAEIGDDDDDDDNVGCQSTESDKCVPVNYICS